MKLTVKCPFGKEVCYDKIRTDKHFLEQVHISEAQFNVLVAYMETVNRRLYHLFFKQ